MLRGSLPFCVIMERSFPNKEFYFTDEKNLTAFPICSNMDDALLWCVMSILYSHVLT